MIETPVYRILGPSSPFLRDTPNCFLVLTFSRFLTWQSMKQKEKALLGNERKAWHFRLDLLCRWLFSDAVTWKVTFSPPLKGAIKKGLSPFRIPSGWFFPWELPANDQKIESLNKPRERGQLWCCIFCLIKFWDQLAYWTDLDKYYCEIRW